MTPRFPSRHLAMHFGYVLAVWVAVIGGFGYWLTAMLIAGLGKREA